MSRHSVDKKEAQKMLAWALTERLVGPASDSDVELPGFEILGVLGQGGMGAVYRAKHLELGREVALKIFNARGSEQDLFVERLKREGRLMAQLEHSNVLGIYDAEVMEDGTPYLVLEYVKGEDLQKRIYERKQLSKKEAIRIAVKVCEGLSAVHKLGIIHRDIKPANVLLGDDGSVKVTDFGVSKETLEEGAMTALTMTGTTIGTVDYMSPEQARGDEVDERSDIYSVGVLLYEMISGVTPRGAFESLAKYGAPRSLDRLVMRCLQRDPERRPGSAANLAQELKKVFLQIRGRRKKEIKPLIYGGVAAAAAVGVMAMFALRGQKRMVDDSTIGEARATPVHYSEVNAVDGQIGVEKDLTADLDMRGNIRNGQWWNYGGKITCSNEKGAMLMLGFRPGGSYTLSMELTRVSGDQAVVIFLPTVLGDLAFVIDQDGFTGVEKLTGHSLRRHPKTQRFEVQNGRLYDFKAEVSPQVLRVWLNGQKTEWALDGQSCELPELWQGADNGSLGLAVVESQVIFSKLRVTRQ